MRTLRMAAAPCFLCLALLSIVSAQDGAGTRSQSSRLTVTAVASNDQVRITAPSSVMQMRIEIYSLQAERLFEQELRGANVFDWQLQDSPCVNELDLQAFVILCIV